MRRMEIFFRLGSWMLVATAVLHLVGFFAGPPPPADETEAELLRLMGTYTRSFVIFERTTMELFEGFSLGVAVLTLFVGLSNLVMMQVHRGRIKGLRIQALLNTVLCAAMLVLSWVYFILPPLVCFGLSLTFFGLAFAAGGYQSDWERSASSLDQY